MKFDYPETLVSAVKNGKLVIFVGAGASMSVGAPGWRELICECLDDISGDFPAANGLKDVLLADAMDDLAVLDVVKNNGFRGRVLSFFHDRLAGVQPGGIHEAIAGLTRKIVTTNYDNALEKAVPNLGVAIARNEYSIRYLREDAFLFKMHGGISEMANCVVFNEDYQGVYSVDGMIIGELKRLLIDHVFLYVGFSLKDPFYRKAIVRHKEVYGDFAKEAYAIEISESYAGVRNIEVGGSQNIEAYFKGLLQASGTHGDGGKDATENSRSGIGRAKATHGIDAPPVVDKWAGRSDELKALAFPVRVFYLTGMGGQGKSALAAKYYSDKYGEYERLYWKDFKEENHNFQSKIVDIICDIRKEIDKDDLLGFSDEALVGEFFKSLGDRKCLFVFDNVDSYVDIESSFLRGGVGALADQAEMQGHKCKFIFTCRPMIFKAGPGVYQLRLDGLAPSDIVQLVDQYGVTGFSESEKPLLAGQIFEITKGHPLWVSFLIVQAMGGKARFNKVVDDFKCKNIALGGGESWGISYGILNPIWDTLNEKQKRMLSYLAECPEALSLDNFANMVSPDMTYQKLHKCLKTLKNLNLIVYKDKGDFIELHPLVREFVTKSYPFDDRTEVIGFIIGFYKSLVGSVRSKLGRKLSLKEFEYWTNKVSVELAAGNRRDAFTDVCEVIAPMSAAGYGEELAGVISRYISSINWDSPSDIKYAQFDKHFTEMMSFMSEFGENDFVEEFVSKYELVVTKQDERYLNVMSIRIYDKWLTGSYEEALLLADRASFIMQKLSATDKYDLRHRMALVRRDSRLPHELAKVEAYFREGIAEGQLLSRSLPSDALQGISFGNMGRWLHLSGDEDAALVCYAKSFFLVHKLEDSADVLLNIGYAAAWMFELLIGKCDEAYYFFAYCINVWRKVSPLNANKLVEKYMSVYDGADFVDVFKQDEIDLEMKCSEYVRSILGR